MDLQEAASRGDPDSRDRISQLLTTEQGRNDINTKDKSQMTPLLNALKLENVQAAILLIEEGADVNIIPASECSALHYAVRISPGDDKDCLPALLLQQSPGLITKTDQGGNTALHKLADSPAKGKVGRLEKMVEVLNMSDIGRSALDEALRSRNVKKKTPCESLRDDILSRGDRENLVRLLTPLARRPERSRSDV
jgi:ankyrin repeat protein